MNEDKWLSSRNPAAILTIFNSDSPFGQVNNCKLRLWVEACREASDRASVNMTGGWQPLAPGENLGIVASWADGGGSLPMGVRADFLRDIIGNPWRPMTLPTEPGPSYPARQIAYGSTFVGELRVRDIYCPWLTPDVLSLASTAYNDRADDGTLDNDRLAVLSDAMEEAGCEEEECPKCGGQGVNLRDYLVGLIPCILCKGRKTTGILAHLRDPGPHVRGCCAIDLLRGQSR